MSRIVLVTSGSYGDVHPYLAVGGELRRRGHDVTIATAEYYRDKVQREGMRFHPIRPDFVPMEAASDVVRRSFDPRSGAQFVLRELIIPYVEQSYRDLLAACAGTDLLVIHPTQFAAPLVAEKLNLKWVSVILSPSVFVSAYDPPIFPPVPWLHSLRHLGPWPHRAVIHGMRHLTKTWMEPIVQLRRREGLSPVRRCAMHADMFSPFGTLAWFSEVIGSPQPDWPAGTRVTGFPLYDRNQPGEDEEAVALHRFLDEGEAPIVFTLGSSAVVDCGDFYEQSLDAVRRLGRRAVFLAGRHVEDPVFASLPDTVFAARYAPYSQVFPRASVVVHQGGIGTVGQALHAGTPMLIVPLGLDQPDNAYRASRAGVARVLPRRKYTAARATEDLRRLMEPRYSAKALTVRTRLESEDGVEAAADALENLCESRQPVTRSS